MFICLTFTEHLLYCRFCVRPWKVRNKQGRYVLALRKHAVSLGRGETLCCKSKKCCSYPDRCLCKINLLSKKTFQFSFKTVVKNWLYNMSWVFKNKDIQGWDNSRKCILVRGTYLSKMHSVTCWVWLEHRIQVGGGGRRWEGRDGTGELGRSRSCHVKGQDIILEVWRGEVWKNVNSYMPIRIDI